MGLPKPEEVTMSVRGRVWIAAAVTAAALAAMARMAPAATDSMVGVAAAATEEAQPVTGAAARTAFERFKKLSGAWHGRSTKGWEDSVSWRTIAGGSVVMQTSFEAHPGETMVTMIALDVDRLALTHYCVAGNQPRLVATACSPDGREIRFTFRDGGNMATRDRGHMDQAVYRFESDDRITGRWTWYQNGQERWMEEIEYWRIQPGHGASLTPPK